MVDLKIHIKKIKLNIQNALKKICILKEYNSIMDT